MFVCGLHIFVGRTSSWAFFFVCVCCCWCEEINKNIERKYVAGREGERDFCAEGGGRIRVNFFKS